MLGKENIKAEFKSEESPTDSSVGYHHIHMKIISSLLGETNYWNVPEKIEFQSRSDSSGNTEF